MIRAIIESPYGGTPEEVQRNTIYARRCMLWALNRGYSPHLSHLLYTQVLDDNDPEERKLGIEAGFAWREAAQVTLVFRDYGVTPRMRKGISHARMGGRRIKVEYISKNALGARSVQEHDAICDMADQISEIADARILAQVIETGDLTAVAEDYDPKRHTGNAGDSEA